MQFFGSVFELFFDGFFGCIVSQLAVVPDANGRFNIPLAYLAVDLKERNHPANFLNNDIFRSSHCFCNLGGIITAQLIIGYTVFNNGNNIGLYYACQFKFRQFHSLKFGR